MLMELGIGSRDVYEDDFESAMLEEAREFFKVRLSIGVYDRRIYVYVYYMYVCAPLLGFSN